MPKPKNDNEYTKAKARYDADSETLGKLQTKAENDKATPADKEAFKKASEKLAADRKVLLRLRFRYVGGSKLTKIVGDIKSLSAFTNRKQYDLTAADVEIIKKALEDSVSASVETLTLAVNTPHGAAAPRDAVVFL